MSDGINSGSINLGNAIPAYQNTSTTTGEVRWNVPAEQDPIGRWTTGILVEPTPDPNYIPKRNISIEQLDRGFILSVGCQRVAITSIEQLVDNIKRYLEDIKGTEKAWNEGTYIV